MELTLWSMPHLDLRASRFRGVVSIFDFLELLQGHWQIPLAEEAQYLVDDSLTLWTMHPNQGATGHAIYHDIFLADHERVLRGTIRKGFWIESAT